MNPFFCADYSREVGEDIIGSATNHQTYILVECPQPWAANAFESESIPEELKRLVADVKRHKLPIKFLLIANQQSHKIGRTKVLIYENQQGLSTNYCRYEFDLANIREVAKVVKQWLHGELTDGVVEASATRDILVCTHGSHDKCCARYGNPFYFTATATIANFGVRNVRVWKASHFGGHRFAPTMIDLPEGRYYGMLSADSFESILMRTGDIKCLNKVYRGLSTLPLALQVLERELILKHGWNWFKYKVDSRILTESLDGNTIRAEISYEKLDGSRCTYRADLVKDEDKTVCLKGSCGAMKESVFVKYSVENLHIYQQEMLWLGDKIA